MSIRLRVALVFALALAAAFALGSWLFLSQLHAQLVSNTMQPKARVRGCSGQSSVR